MKTPKNNPAAGLLTAIGSLAELAHHFYASMIAVGATKEEAQAGMQSFISTELVVLTSGKTKEKDGNDDDTE